MKHIVQFFRWVNHQIFKVTGAIKRFDKRMREKYRPAQLAFWVVAVIAVIASVMLFVPPYLGLSNDGSFDDVLKDTGMQLLEPDRDDRYFNYYDRVYVYHTYPDTPDTTPFLLRAAVGLAQLIDNAVTWDEYFDMRFLAAIYLVLYLALLYPLIRGVLSRVSIYSEGLAVGVVAVLVFAYVSMITRLASLYTQPLEWLLLLLMVNMMDGIAQSEGMGVYPVVLAAATILLMTVNPYCALAGVVIAMIYWGLLRLNISNIHRSLYLVCSLILCMSSVIATAQMTTNQSLEQKYNQMTRGVLFQTDNPEKTLEEFGIEPRYSILTETYATQSFPVVLPSSGVLDEGFFDRYSTSEVILHYVRHPGALIGMFDIGVHDAFVTRPSYSGNYERSVGLPEKAKSPWMALWSTFKEQSAPKTAGALVIILLAFGLIRKKKKKDTDEDRKKSLFSSLFYVLVGFATVEIMTVVIMSGDSELISESFLMGCCIDVLFILLLGEILHKTKIIETEE